MEVQIRDWVGFHGPLGHCEWFQRSCTFQFCPKVKKEYQRFLNNTLSNIALNLADNQFAHIRYCKGTNGGMEGLCNIHEAGSLTNILAKWSALRHIIVSFNIYFGDDSILKAIGVGSIVVYIMVRRKIYITIFFFINHTLHVSKLHAT